MRSRRIAEDRRVTSRHPYCRVRPSDVIGRRGPRALQINELMWLGAPAPLPAVRCQNAWPQSGNTAYYVLLDAKTEPGSIRTRIVPAAAFILTTTYVVLSHLSSAVLFPHLAKYNIMVWLAVAATLACLPLFLLHPSRWRSPEVYLMLGLTAAVPVALIANGQAGGALRGLREFLVTGVVFFLVLAAVDTVRKMRVLAFVVVISAVCLLSQSLYGWYQNGLECHYVYRAPFYNAQHDEFARLRSVGFLDDPNDFAQFLLVAASLLKAAWSPGRWRRNLALHRRRFNPAPADLLPIPPGSASRHRSLGPLPPIPSEDLRSAPECFPLLYLR
jgi:hypothetical protein